ncbi:hypothetical protein [Rhodovulum sp. PH10]|uniref:hypothetical protein n=1 Tax=Rhodovulum sp. PH10 TaxID=1187851 RepID=UPI0012F9333C|nr:hypothetical protein [Rhodovulum sp. PH10]
MNELVPASLSFEFGESLMKTFIFLLLGIGVAHAQGVDQSVTSGAPPVYQAPAPSVASPSTAVPTGPRPQSYPPRSGPAYPGEYGRSAPEPIRPDRWGDDRRLPNPRP